MRELHLEKLYVRVWHKNDEKSPGINIATSWFPSPTEAKSNFRNIFKPHKILILVPWGPRNTILAPEDTYYVTPKQNMILVPRISRLEHISQLLKSLENGDA